jgi:hypothetical protein
LSRLNGSVSQFTIPTDIHGFVLAGNLKILRLEPLPNKNTKDEANKQKPAESFVSSLP